MPVVRKDVIVVVRFATGHCGTISNSARGHDEHFRQDRVDDFRRFHVGFRRRLQRPRLPSRPRPRCPQVDVEAVLTELAKTKKEKLDWRKSIVDLMKLLDLDSGLGARKELAKELNYTGDTNDSATMNVWLHKQVMKKLAENGGKVPDDLKS